MQYLDRNELPAHWDREALFGLDDASSVNESKGGSDGDSSEEETREEKDHFVAQLYKFMDDNGTPINKGPTINSRDLDLYRLFKIVNKMGGFNRVTNQNGWKSVTQKLILNSASNSSTHVKQAYKKWVWLECGYDVDSFANRIFSVGVADIYTASKTSTVSLVAQWTVHGGQNHERDLGEA